MVVYRFLDLLFPFLLARCLEVKNHHKIMTLFQMILFPGKCTYTPKPVFQNLFSRILRLYLGSDTCIVKVVPTVLKFVSVDLSFGRAGLK